MLPTENILGQLSKFRSLMGLSLSKDNVKNIWGKKYLKNLPSEKLKKLKENQNPFALEKIKICKNNISKLKILNWIQFVGISGSVAAGFAKEEDDIDVFIVVKNGTMWIYRGIVVFLNLFHNKIRAKRHKNVRNKLCLNLICEERGLQFEEDLFNFHELMFLIPIYNEKYLNFIYSENDWLEKKYNVKKENLITRIRPRKKANILILSLNYLAFLSQLFFMYISGHRPDVQSLKDNCKEGRIEFFEKSYKEKIIRDYLKEFKSTN